MNGFCGTYSLFQSAAYLISGDKGDLRWAMGLPLAGLMFDFMDGKVARWTKSSSMLGQELDSLADSVSVSYLEPYSVISTACVNTMY